MKMTIFPLLAAMTLAGCATSKPADWRNYVVPGPNGVKTSEVTSRDKTADDSRMYSLRFAREACTAEGRSLVVTDRETTYIGPEGGELLARDAITVASALYTRNTGKFLGQPADPLRWKTVTTFRCE